MIFGTLLIIEKAIALDKEATIKNVPIAPLTERSMAGDEALMRRWAGQGQMRTGNLDPDTLF